MTTDSADPSPSFGSALRSHRMARGMSLGDLARLVNYSKSHLSRVETGNKQPTTGLARRCDEVLDGGGCLSKLAADLPVRVVRTTASLAQLPRVVPDVIEREELVNRLDAALELLGDPHAGRSAVVLLDGPVGAGKTTTAVHWGHRTARHFPDGTLFADLNGFGPAPEATSPATVLRGFLQAMGAAAGTLPEDTEALAARFRTELTGRRLLIVLDNAADAAQIRPLLPAEPGCLVLITSRNRMPGLVARDGVRRVTVPPMTTAEGLRLVASLTEDTWDEEAARGLVEACCHLPLPIRVAASEHTWPPVEAPHAVIDNAALLCFLSISEDDTTTLSGLLGHSYRALDMEAARAFRILGTGAFGGFTVREAAGLLGSGATGARRLLWSLANVHMVRYADGEFSFDSILRAFALECVRSVETGRDSA
ncbi:helix-turn-helix domain-containing protein [Streptomyces cucumeris]|uniref:helix-turn-helix domain-containing protein n=1 Tax=Streptomyces cucumeris TaxID=2962890 RepID=UPI003D764F5A